MTRRDKDRKHAASHNIWGLVFVMIVGLYVLVVALRPLYDLLVTL